MLPSRGTCGRGRGAGGGGSIAVPAEMARVSDCASVGLPWSVSVVFCAVGGASRCRSWRQGLARPPRAVALQGPHMVDASATPRAQRSFRVLTGGTLEMPRGCCWPLPLQTAPCVPTSLPENRVVSVLSWVTTQAGRCWASHPGWAGRQAVHARPDTLMVQTSGILRRHLGSQEKFNTDTLAVPFLLWSVSLPSGGS